VLRGTQLRRVWSIHLSTLGGTKCPMTVSAHHGAVPSSENYDDLVADRRVRQWQRYYTMVGRSA